MGYKLKDSYGLYIDGKFVPASDGSMFVTTNPANGEKLATCAEATKDDVQKAVDAAWRAYPKWKAMDPTARVNILNQRQWRCPYPKQLQGRRW